MKQKLHRDTFGNKEGDDAKGKKSSYSFRDFAGLWDEKEYKKFVSTVKELRKIDKELWR